MPSNHSNVAKKIGVELPCSSHKKGEVPTAETEVKTPTGSTPEIDAGIEPIGQHKEDTGSEKGRDSKKGRNISSWRIQQL